MSQRLRFAILGAGMIAEYHQQAIQRNVDLGAELVAIAHHRPERFAAISAQFGVPCHTYDDVLNDPAVDVIAICTPSGQHPEQAIRAAQAGKHVIVEKPMALTAADADAIIAACDTAGVKLGVAFQSRARPLFRQMHAAIQAGDLGDLTLGIVTMPYFRPPEYYAQADWRGTWTMDGGGVLMNQGIHQVDLLVWFMGDPVRVQAHAATLHRAIEVEDTLVAALTFANGAMATIVATTTAAPGHPHRIELYGTGGSIRTEGDALHTWTPVKPEAAVVTPPEPTPLAGAGAGGSPRGINVEGHIALFRDFVEAVRDDRAPLIDGAEGRRSVALVNAIYAAAGIQHYE